MADLEQAVVVEPSGGDSVEPPTVGAGQEHRVGGNQEHVVVLNFSQWRQILRANEVYAALSRGASVHAEPLARSPARRAGTGETVAIRVGRLRWRTIVAGSGPSLAALRRVETPSGVFVQGFTVNTGRAALAGAGVADGVSVVAHAPQDELAIAVSLADTGWYVVASTSDVSDEVSTRARAEIAAFRRTFALFFACAVVAALCVAVIVAQADGLARQRMRFAAAAAHELKTPLSTVRLYSDMLAEGLGDPARARTYAARIAAEAGRLGRVVVNILDLSRLERGSSVVQPEVGDLGETVGRCVDSLRPALTDSGLKVDLEIADQLPRARFDADAVCQIVTNLLDNAERHTRGTAERGVGVRVEEHGGRLRVVVADNGPGISERQARHLFRFFVRGASHRSPAGLGLGLSLGRSLARAQGGELRLLEAAPGQGAIFELSLPPAD
jgi:signal transduction histidine kinase